MVYKDKHLRAAYSNGWRVCAAGSPRQPRPAYHTHDEREAYDEGWNDCGERVALGYPEGIYNVRETGAQGA